MYIPDNYRTVAAPAKGAIGLMGLSLGKKIFYDTVVMTGYAKFMQAHFAQSYFIIADTPKCHNIMALEGVTYDEALKRVCVGGQQMRRFLDKIVAPYLTVHVLNWDDIIEPGYKTNLSFLQEYYQTNDSFRDACNETVLQFLDIPANKAKYEARSMTCAQALARAHYYFIEEMAGVGSFPVTFESPCCWIYPEESDTVALWRTFDDATLSNLVHTPTSLFMPVCFE